MKCVAGCICISVGAILTIHWFILGAHEEYACGSSILVSPPSSPFFVLSVLSAVYYRPRCEPFLLQYVGMEKHLPSNS